MAFVGLWVLATSPSLLTVASLYWGSFGTPRPPGLPAAPAVLAVLGALLVGLPFLLQVGVGFALILNRSRLSDSLFDDLPLDLGADPLALLYPLVVLLGLWLSVTAAAGLLVSITRALSTLVQAARFSGGATGGTILGQQLLAAAPELVGRIIELALGLVFLFRSRRVVTWVLSMQESDA
jgi:hypothetical protein